MKHVYITTVICILYFQAFSQKSKKKTENIKQDSLYIAAIQDKHEPDKVLHAEPLYIDLIRDLGARKGEKEWNVAAGLTDNNTHDAYTALVEYEFAPINRLGLEIELPFTFYFPNSKGIPRDSIPGSRLNSLKLAAQYTFFVSEKRKTSLALGYIHEFEFPEFRRYGKELFFKGNIYNPFLVVAKRWGNNYHTLLYTGPSIEHYFKTKHTHMIWQFNSSFHYMITGTGNFIGVEFNKEVSKGDFDMTIRPQMRLGIADNILLGIVAGIPIKRENERFSAFVRLIYEPGHKHQKRRKKDTTATAPEFT